MMIAAVIAALGLMAAIAFTTTSAHAAVRHHAGTAHRHLRHATVSGSTDPASAGDVGDSGTQGEQPSAESDGPGGTDAGGDHQCPPACSPGEQG
jgi:hypothetical protein